MPGEAKRLASRHPAERNADSDRHRERVHRQTEGDAEQDDQSHGGLMGGAEYPGLGVMSRLAWLPLGYDPLALEPTLKHERNVDQFRPNTGEVPRPGSGGVLV